MTKLEQLCRAPCRHRWENAWREGSAAQPDALDEAVENSWRNYLPEVRVLVEAMLEVNEVVWKRGQRGIDMTTSWAEYGAEARSMWREMIDAILKEQP